MKDTTVICLFVIILILSLAIIFPPITGTPLTRMEGIFTGVTIGLLLLVFAICISVDSAEYESNIDDLKNRIQELENKLNNTKGKNTK